jgi:hypothetical protein
MISLNNRNSKNRTIIKYNRYNKNKDMYGGGPVAKLPFLLNQPHGIAINNAGYVFIADTLNHCIHIFLPNPDYTLIHTLGIIGAADNTDNQFNNPDGIAIHRHNEEDILYIADKLNHRIQVFRITIQANNTITATHLPNIIGSPHSIGTGKVGRNNNQFHRPSGLVIHDNILYVSDTYNQRIQVFLITINDNNTITALHIPSQSASLNSIGTGMRDDNNDTFKYPYGLAIENNILYVADSGNDRIQMFHITINANNTITTIHLPGVIVSPQSIGNGIREDDINNFSEPIGLYIHNNILYIADSRNNRILMFQITINGNNTITALHQSSIPFIPFYRREKSVEYKFFYPCAVVFHNDRLFVADTLNNRIQIFNINLSNSLPMQYYKTIIPLASDFKMLNREINVPSNIRDTPCRLCNFPLCQRFIDTTNNLNGYIVHLHNLRNPNIYYYHYKCLFRYFTQISLSDNPYKSPHCEIIIDRHDIHKLLHIDRKVNAIVGDGFYL